MKRIHRCSAAFLFFCLGWMGIQTVFLLVQARQGAFLLQGLERVVRSSGDPVIAEQLTKRLGEYSQMRWIRCFQLAEQTPSAERADNHSCGRFSFLEGVAPAERQILGDQGKVFRVRVETMPSPEYEALLWMMRGLMLMGALGMIRVLRRVR